MTKSYFNIREALEVGTDEIVDAYKKATPGEVKEEDDAPASPDEAGMAMDQAKFIGYVADEIMEYIQGNNEFPEWMQNKLSALHEKAKGMHAVMAGKYESVKESFKPHMMYDPKTGKAYKAEKPEDHERMAKMGYSHKSEQKESVDLGEKLQVSDGMAKWIEDFQKSDAPQFVEKDKNERREMAIAAYLAAKRKAKKED